MNARRMTFTALMLGATLALSACGQTQMERIGSGAAIGTGIGLGVGAVTGATLLTGGLIGAGVGAVGGALTPDCPYDQWRWGW